MSAGQESYKAGCRSRGSNIQCGIENIDPVDVLLPVESDEAKQWFVDICIACQERYAKKCVKIWNSLL